MPLDPNTETGSPQIPAKQLHYAGTLQELEANLHAREIGFCTETRLCYIKDQFGTLVPLGGAYVKSAHISEHSFTAGTPVNILSYGTDKFWITVSGTQLTLGYSNTGATPRLLDTKNGVWSSSGGTRVNCNTGTGSYFDRDMYVYNESTGASVVEYSIRVNISGTKLKVTAIY